MDTKKKEYIHNIYNISIITLSIIVGIIFILCAYSIYYKGLELRVDDPNYQIFNEEIIRKYLIIAFIPFILWILVIVGGVVISKYIPLNIKKKIKIDEIEVYKKLKKKIPSYNENYVSEYKIIKKERMFRKLALSIVSIISLLCMIMPARFLFNKENFAENKVSEAKAMLFNVFPWILLVFILYAVFLVLHTKSIKKETTQIKEILKTYKETIIKDEKEHTLTINITRIGVLVIGITFVILGIINGNVNDVLQKAINICTECIGLA